MTAMPVLSSVASKSSQMKALKARDDTAGKAINVTRSAIGSALYVDCCKAMRMRLACELARLSLASRSEPS